MVDIYIYVYIDIWFQDTTILSMVFLKMFVSNQGWPVDTTKNWIIPSWENAGKMPRFLLMNLFSEWFSLKKHQSIMIIYDHLCKFDREIIIYIQNIRSVILKWNQTNKQKLIDQAQSMESMGCGPKGWKCYKWWNPMHYYSI